MQGLMKIIITFLVGMLMFTGCSEQTGNENTEISGTEFILGTIISIQIMDHGSEALLEQCFDRLRAIEQDMSGSIESSDIAILNAQSKNLSSGDLFTPVTVSDDVYEVMEAGLAFGSLSDGGFDISLGPIIDLWKIGTDEANVPNEDLIIEALTHVDYTKIQLLENNQVIIEPGMDIDLGGIAKGYAADEVASILVEAGVESAIINLGGNIKVIGGKTPELPFNVGIQNPDDARNEYIGIISVRDKTVVTSGDYERYFYEDGIKYHHIFNQETGYPHVTDIASVTVVCDDSITADALSTVLFLMTLEEGIALVNSMENVDCIYVTKAHEVYKSDGPLVTDFRITDEQFTLMNLGE